MFLCLEVSNMFTLSILQLILIVCAEEDGKMSVTDVAVKLGDLIKIDHGNEMTESRLEELNYKLTNVSKFVIDRDHFVKLLLNETKEDNLNHSSFLETLKGENGTNLLLLHSHKSLYQTLLEKMNTDDVERILLKINNKYKKMFDSARRSATYNKNPSRKKLDAYISSVMTNLMMLDSFDHTIGNQSRKSNYWNPAAELEDLVEYHNLSGRRLFKAKTGEIEEYPFMVSVHVMGRFWCGGVLYQPDLVLTSSSCLQLLYNNRLFRENPRVLAVRIASNHSLVGGELIAALEVYFHPAYNPKTLQFNIAAIRLQRHVFFNHKHIPKLIEIAIAPNPPPSNVVVVVLGWGASKAYAAVKYEPSFLQKQVLPIYPNYFCKEVYGEKFVKESMFCAGTITTGEGACDYDGGGPAILDGRLVGIISFGPPVCGQANSPTVFTNVGFVANWINSIKKNMPGYHRQIVKTTTMPTTKQIKTQETKTTAAVEETTTVQPAEPYNTSVEKEGIGEK